jgi:polar amino acid transport system substrate-binding protein
LNLVNTLFLPAILISLLQTSTDSQAEPLTVRADVWCPYNCAPHARNRGVFIEMIQYAFGNDGYTIEYDILPWTQAVADVRTGKFDAVVGAAASDTVGLAHTEKPQLFQSTCAFGLITSKVVIKEATDLKKFNHLACSKDYSYGAATDKVLKDPSMKDKVSAIGGDDPLSVNIRRVLDKKMDAIIEDENVMNYILKEKKITNIKKLGCTEDLFGLWIAFNASHPKSKNWVSLMEAGQANLEKSGKLEKILIKYGIKPN